MAASRVLPLERDDECTTCGATLEKGSKAFWDAEHKVVYCLDHQPEDPNVSRDQTSIDKGEAGRSAQREEQRRSARREQRVRTKHPLIGGVLLTVSDEPQTTKAFGAGNRGERIVGGHLDALADRGVIALHDRKGPRSVQIDHIAIAPTGVYVIDAKCRQSGRVEMRESGSFFNPGPQQLFVGRRNCMKLVGKMGGQVGAVMSALEGANEASGVPVVPMLTFVNVEWGFFRKPIDIAGVKVVWPKEMDKIVGRPGPLPPDAVLRIAEHLASKLKPA